MVIATTFPRARVLLAGALLAGSLFFSPARLLAQRTSAPPGSRSSRNPQQTDTRNLQFRSMVNRVVVDVVVTDAAGKPVHGLSQQDFAVTEDNVPQRVVSFDVHDFDSVSESLPPNLPPLPANTFLNLPAVPERGPLYVLLLDLVNTETQDQMWSRQELLKFVDSKPAGTRFEVFVLSDELRLVQGFTSDRNLLAAALDPKHPKHHVPKVFLYGQNYGQGDKGAMISVFLFIAQHLEGLPGRKNLMWMANYFPFSTSPIEGDAFDLGQETKQAIDAMTRAQVAVYTFAACGLSADDPGCGGVLGTSGAALGLPMFSAVAATDVTTKTGGKAYRVNDFKGELADALQDGANYYTLTYAPSNSAYDGKERHIKVQLTQPDKHGYDLAYRRSYYADDPDAPVVQKISAKDEQGPPPPRKPGDSLMANMQYGAPMAHQLIFRAHVQAVGAPGLGTAAQMANLAEQPAYFQVRKKNRPVTALKPIELQTYTVDFNVLLPPKAGSSGSTPPITLEFATAAFDAEGMMLNGVVENGVPNTSAEAKSSRGQNANSAANQAANEKFYRAQEQIDVPLGATSIRIAVRDMTTDHVGAIEVALPLAAEGQAQTAVPAGQAQAADSAAAKPN
jgi:VWFA-related protein